MNEAPHSDHRVLSGLALVTLVVITPFFTYHLMRGAWFMAVVAGLLVLFTLAAVCWVHRHRDHGRLIRGTGTVIVVMGNISVLLAIVGEQQNTVFWVYPLIFINFYLLPLWLAAVVNLLVCGSSLWIVHGAMPTEQFIRLAGSIPLCLLFGVVFSQAILRQRHKLHYLANHDALTGVGNRHGLTSALDEAAERLQRYGETSSLVLLDIDHFKPINDSLGHLGGDEVIVQFARLLEGRIRRTDRLFRFGGEEFVILLPHTSLSEGFHLGESLRVAAENHRFAKDRSLTCSGGVAELDGSEDPAAWLDRADRALYRAKQEGRNRIVTARSPVSG